MRKQLSQYRGQKATVFTTFGVNFMGFVGEIDDHVVAFFSHPRGEGERRYVRVEHVAMLAPVEQGDTPALVSG